MKYRTYVDKVYVFLIPTCFWKPCPKYNYLKLQTNNYSEVDSTFIGNNLNKNNFIRTGLRGK